MSAPRSLPARLKPYRVSSAFGIIRNINGKNTPSHNGADWATPTGIPLEATIAGKVSLVGGSLTHVWGYYVHIICTCPKKHVVEYHILRDKPTFKIGDPIRLGQHIGYTGSSGALNGKRYAPHHHHGVSVGGKYYDPLSIGWAGTSGGAATPIDNEEDDMDAEQNRKLDAVYNAIFAGGSSMDDNGRSISKSLAGIVTVVDQIKGTVTQRVQRGHDSAGEPIEISQIQELADAKTIAIRLEAQLSAMNAAVSALAVAKGVDPEKLSTLIAGKVDAALADNFAAIPAGVNDDAAARMKS